METGDILNLLLIIAFAVGAPLLSVLEKKKRKSKTTFQPADGGQGFFNADESENDWDTDTHDQPASKNKHAHAYSEEEMLNKRNDIKKAFNQINDQNLTKNKASVQKGKNNDVNPRRIKQALNQDISDDLRSQPKSEAAKIVNSFDIKKAVIFSEILNTKYF
ncbi:MAG: hypothetical protein U9Q98_12655 [Bacteroidota bacterium]|nr:hypothetical protein [Bacteroidota bacterium]